MSKLLLLLIAFYRRWISPLLPACCRYVPSCSEYAAEAIAHYGALRGSWKALWRLLRCHPFARGGYDPAVTPAPVIGIDTAPRWRGVTAGNLVRFPGGSQTAARQDGKK